METGINALQFTYLVVVDDVITTSLGKFALI